MANYKPTFAWEISLGQVIQAVVVIVTITGAYFAHYMQVTGDNARTQAEEKLDYAVLNLKLLQEDQKYTTLASDDAAFKAEMRGAIDKVNAAVEEMRVQLVLKADIKKTR